MALFQSRLQNKSSTTEALELVSNSARQKERTQVLGFDLFSREARHGRTAKTSRHKGYTQQNTLIMQHRDETLQFAVWVTV
jgi:hypothetical protein